MPWTEEMIAELTELCRDYNRYTNTKIAQKLARKFNGLITRNSVISKRRSLGLSHAEIDAAGDRREKPGGGPPQWPDEAVDALVRTHNNGGSRQDCAMAVSEVMQKPYTKDQCEAQIAKIRKQGNISLREGHHVKVKLYKPPTERSRAISLKPDEDFEVDPIPFPRENINTQCAWPISGEGANMMVCGKETIERGKPYCAHHAARSRQRATPQAAPAAKKKVSRFNVGV